MNPSAEEIAEAIQDLYADHVFVLPNNKNVILTAKQAAQIVDTPVTVLETKTIPQGMAALVAYDAEKEPSENRSKMQEQIASIRSGEITYAVRDTEINGLVIKQGDYMGMIDGNISCNGDQLFEVAETLLAKMIDHETELVTLIAGQEVSKEQTEQWIAKLEQKYQDHEFELYDGGQPLYYFLIGVE